MDNSNINDEANDYGLQALQGCKALAAEGISQRIDRIRKELTDIVQASVLLNALHTNYIKNKDDHNRETLNSCSDMVACGATAEALLVTAVATLSPLAQQGGGEALDSALNSALKTVSDDWIVNFFIGAFSDECRAEKVELLNRILQKQEEE